jgi:hypothetical protein
MVRWEKESNEWYRWYAWYPVPHYEGGWMWLETVLRRRSTIGWSEFRTLTRDDRLEGR